MTDTIVMPGSSKHKIICLFLVALLPAILAGSCKKKKTTEPPAVLPGEIWSSRSTGGLYDLRDVATDGTVFVAVGDSGRIITSADSGKSWTLRSVGFQGKLNGVVSTASYGFVSVSSQDAGDTILFSSNGTGWTPRTTFTVTGDLNTVTGFGSLLIAGGCNGLIFTSNNGISWNQRTSPSDTCVEAVKRCGLTNASYIAVGQNGAIYTSTDGFGWILRTAVTNAWLRDVACGCSRAVAVGDGGVIRVSTDGIVWTTVTSVGVDLNAIVCNGDTFVAVGKNGVVYTSHDAGTTWIQRTSPTTKELFGVARIGETYLAVGLDGTTITSP